MLEWREHGEKIKYKELSANTVAFISCRISRCESGRCRILPLFLTFFIVIYCSAKSRWIEIENVVKTTMFLITFKILDEAPKKRPRDGCCIWGLFVEGARWSSGKRLLTESRPKELYTGEEMIHKSSPCDRESTEV